MQHASGGRPRFSLLVERGQTGFPERPIDTDRFLVGGGTNCHLQLGGEIPQLHSIIIPEGDHLWMDSVAVDPPLVINGQCARESELHHGDIIEIGDFVFCVSVSSAPPAGGAALPLARQSAGELVDALERELHEWQQARTGPVAGALALLEAARAAGGDSELDDDQAPELQDLLQELRDRAAELDRREEALRAHARQLEATQQELHQQMELLCDHLMPEMSPAPLKLRA